MAGNRNWNKYKNLCDFLHGGKKKKKKDIPLCCLKVAAALSLFHFNQWVFIQVFLSIFPYKFLTVAYTTTNSIEKLLDSIDHQE